MGFGLLLVEGEDGADGQVVVGGQPLGRLGELPVTLAATLIGGLFGQPMRAAARVAWFHAAEYWARAV